jgi:ribosomal protein S18 acetylase RimI-like enzyme
VHPDWQRKGLGSLLFRTLIDAARTLMPRIARIELMVRAGNTDAIRLYQRLGFKIEGRFVGRVYLPDGTVEDDIAMALLL